MPEVVRYGALAPSGQAPQVLQLGSENKQDSLYTHSIRKAGSYIYALNNTDLLESTLHNTGRLHSTLDNTGRIKSTLNTGTVHSIIQRGSHLFPIKQADYTLLSVIQA
jgi:hypothetical protein